MTSPSVHQFVPTWEPGAIGTHVLGVHNTLQNAGISCTTWASEIRAGLAPIARDAAEFFADRAARPDTILLYHSAVGAPMGDELLRRPEPLVLDHHNVTPPEFFDTWHPALAENLEVGEAQVATLARHACFGIADSAFNAAQLQQFGCAATAVAPVFIDLHKSCDDALVVELGRRPGTAWLFVGRIAPNKAPHDIVRALAWYRRGYDPDAHLYLVGGGPSDAYRAALLRLVDRLGLHDAVVLTGPVTDAQLGAHYRAADVFVSLSSHEGFGVPIVEAMAAGLPVVALDAAAVCETAAGAALLVPHAEPALVAGAVARVVRDNEVRHALVDAGRARSEAFRSTVVAARWVEVIAEAFAAAGLVP